MKNLLLTLFLILAHTGFCQNIPSDATVIDVEDRTLIGETKTYNLLNIEIKPEFPGGIAAFDTFILKHFAVPNEKDLKGKIYFTFTIQADGALTGLKVIRDIGFGTGKELIRVLKKSPKWTPGKQKGKAVPVVYSHSIVIENSNAGK